MKIKQVNFGIITLLFFSFFLNMCQVQPSAGEIRHKENMGIAAKEEFNLMGIELELKGNCLKYIDNTLSHEESQSTVNSYADSISAVVDLRHIAFMSMNIHTKHDSNLTAFVGQFKDYDYSKKSINGRPMYGDNDKLSGKPTVIYSEYTLSDVRDINPVTIDGKTYTRILGIRIIGARYEDSVISSFFYYVYYP
jgi:hypothetical protein